MLHGILVNPPIAIVGLSNWVLDPAKACIFIVDICMIFFDNGK